MWWSNTLSYCASSYSAKTCYTYIIRQWRNSILLFISHQRWRERGENPQLYVQFLDTCGWSHVLTYIPTYACIFLHNCTGKQRKWPVPSELTLELIEYIWSINQQLSTKNDYLGPNMGVAENFPFLDGNNFPFDWIMKKIFLRTYFFLFPRNTNQLMSANMLAFFSPDRMQIDFRPPQKCFICSMDGYYNIFCSIFWAKKEENWLSK